MRIALTTLLVAISSMAMAAGDGLAICSQCPGTSLVSLTGADTSNARTTARITEDDMRNWCQGWNP